MLLKVDQIIFICLQLSFFLRHGRNFKGKILTKILKPENEV